MVKFELSPAALKVFNKILELEVGCHQNSAGRNNCKKALSQNQLTQGSYLNSVT